MSRMGRNGTRLPCASTPEISARQRLDLQAIDGGHRVAVVHQMMRQREARRAQPDHQHLVARSPRARTAARSSADSSASAGCRSRSPTAVPAHLSACAFRPAECPPAPASGKCRTSCSRCRCGGRCRRTWGCRWSTMASAPIGLPLLLHHVHLGDLLFERAAGQLHAEHAGFERRRPFPSGRCEQLSLPWLWHLMQ